MTNTLPSYNEPFSFPCTDVFPDGSYHKYVVGYVVVGNPPMGGGMRFLAKMEPPSLAPSLRQRLQGWGLSEWTFAVDVSAAHLFNHAVDAERMALLLPVAAPEMWVVSYRDVHGPHDPIPEPIQSVEVDF